MAMVKPIITEATNPREPGQLFCADLPSSFQPNIGKVLVTGASGYIGGRIVPELLARGYKVRVMVRKVSPEYSELWPGVELVVADALEIEALRTALKDIDTAFYLIHSLRLGPKEFAAADMQAAGNFRIAAEENNLKRIIYLGGLGDIRSPLSSHLRSRAEVTQELRKGKVPVTVLRYSAPGEKTKSDFYSTLVKEQVPADRHTRRSQISSRKYGDSRNFRKIF
jgi:nucleoside-diphosphate-sugar epimerase